MNKKNSKKNLSIVGLLQVGATFTLLFSIVSLFDQYHRYLELLSHFKLQYLIITASCAVIFAVIQKYKFAMILFIGAIINATFVIPWYFNDPENQVNNGPYIHNSFTVLHSNLLSSNTQFADFIKMIKAQDPDILIMQEVNDRWLSAIQSLEQIYPHHLSIPRNDNFGIALFSKHPFQSIEQANWGSEELPSIVAQIPHAGQIITLFATHPLPPVSDYYYLSRNDQISAIAKASVNQQGPLIVIGDLNVTMFSHDYSLLEHKTDLRNARKGFGTLPTWPTQLLPFMIPIDHCLVSSHIIVNDIYLGPNIGSDHLPVIVKLGLKNPELKKPQSK